MYNFQFSRLLSRSCTNVGLVRLHSIPATDGMRYAYLRCYSNSIVEFGCVEISVDKRVTREINLNVINCDS